ncbi:hypothetical protein RHOFW510R12_01190 [Rhodanobacter sp. FW510-R12]
MQPAMTQITSYLRSFAGLDEAIAACPHSTTHEDLVCVIHRGASLRSARLATSRGDKWLLRRKVFAADGTLVANDHQAWLAQEVERDDGNVADTCARLDAAGYRLGLCRITTLYVVAAGDSGAAADFLQVEVDLEEEIIDREIQPGQGWSTPLTLDALVHEAEQGPALSDPERRVVRGPTYRLRRVVDVGAWLGAADALEDVRREAVRDRRYRVTTAANPAGVVRTQDELDLGWDRYPTKHRRFFQDWARSSAGQHRLCDHWVLDLKDWTDPRTGHRSMEMIPVWAFNRPLARVNAAKGSEYEFYGALEKLDRRVGVPFAWFFYMVHGNRVDADAGDRVIRAAEAGTIVIPERDYRVLKDWQAAPYAF